MSIKSLISLTTSPTQNEQTGATPLTISSAGTTQSREYRELGSFNRAVFYLDVSAISGTSPSLTVTVQAQNPLSLKWRDVVTFPAQTAVSGTPSSITPITAELYDLNYRAQFVVAGTSPSVTFTLCCVAGCEEPIT